MNIPMRGTLVLVGALAVLGLSFVSGSAVAANLAITVEAHDDGSAFWFEVPGKSGKNPDIVVAPGDVVNFTVVQKGTVPHNFHIGGTAFKTPVKGAPSTDYLVWTVPAEFKSAEYYCDPHQSVGMKGKLVTAGASTPTPENKSPGFDLAVLALGAVGVALLYRRR